MLYAANKSGGTDSCECGICKRTFQIPVNNLVLVKLPGVPIEWDIDIGGYCVKCEGYRCERHISTREGVEKNSGYPDVPITELFCMRCNERIAFTR